MMLSVAVTVLLAIGFHILQNSGAVQGGTLPVAKTAWLFTVLFYWYVLPAIFCADKSLPKIVRVLFVVALCNMVLRAAFELPMMYVTQTWLHAYGIGHDIFSLILCSLLAVILVLSLSRKHAIPEHGVLTQRALVHRAQAMGWPSHYFIFSAFLFMIEAVFASYLRSVTNANGEIFFLPPDPAHQTMLVVTTVLVVFSWGMIFYLARQWHEQRS